MCLFVYKCKTRHKFFIYCLQCFYLIIYLYWFNQTTFFIYTPILIPYACFMDAHTFSLGAQVSFNLELSQRPSLPVCMRYSSINSLLSDSPTWWFYRWSIAPSSTIMKIIWPLIGLQHRFWISISIFRC